MAEGLLPGGRDVPFAEIEVTLARIVRDGRRRRRGPARALTATVIVVGKPERLIAAAEALEQLGEAGGVRAILISEGEHTAPIARVTENAIAISGLTPRYLNNAVAALRLSSLPTLVWWRGGPPELLDGLADLADRLVLDAADPKPVWARVGAIAERAATSDLRWTRLTRGRALMAHFWGIPGVRAAAPGFDRLRIEGSDSDAARLYAAWLVSSLGWTPATLEVRERQGAAPIECVELGDGEQSLALRTAASRTC